ncbi:MAG: transporter substrate-binding domain-containing protein [Burkholderiales bacterium]|nr:transporter substrate-binding domain-containing protein [Burkholderiales bacterium]
MKQLIALALMLTALAAQATETVRVGVVVFPPYIVPTADGQSMHVELLDVMNEFQSDYHFVPVVSGPIRRFKDFEAGRYDLSFFDNLLWGWEGQPVSASEVFLSGAEVYVALAKYGRDEHYFDDLNAKRMIGMRGYHYGFANYNADPAYLEDNFRMVLTGDNEATIKVLLAHRGDVAVVTEAYLSTYLLDHPALRASLLISKRKDQVYSHSVIVRNGVHPTPDEINKLFARMRKAGVLRALWHKYGVAEDGSMLPP